VEISDLSSDVMSDLLAYIYSGNAPKQLITFTFKILLNSVYLSFS